jgi:hypothetical protein
MQRHDGRPKPKPEPEAPDPNLLDWDVNIVREKKNDLKGTVIGSPNEKSRRHGGGFFVRDHGSSRPSRRSRTYVACVRQRVKGWNAIKAAHRNLRYPPLGGPSPYTLELRRLDR